MSLSSLQQGYSPGHPNNQQVLLGGQMLVLKILSCLQNIIALPGKDAAV